MFASLFYLCSCNSFFSSSLIIRNRPYENKRVIASWKWKQLPLFVISVASKSFCFVIFDDFLNLRARFRNDLGKSY